MNIEQAKEQLQILIPILGTQTILDEVQTHLIRKAKALDTPYDQLHYEEGYVLKQTMKKLRDIW